MGSWWRTSATRSTSFDSARLGEDPCSCRWWRSVVCESAPGRGGGHESRGSHANSLGARAQLQHNTGEPRALSSVHGQNHSHMPWLRTAFQPVCPQSCWSKSACCPASHKGTTQRKAKMIRCLSVCLSVCLCLFKKKMACGLKSTKLPPPGRG
jgi:hypothetical protein